MPPARARRRVQQIDYQGERTVSRVPAESERAKGISNIGELFDGSVWSIWPEDDITPTMWAVRERDWVPMIVGESKRDGCGETDYWNWVLRDVGYLEKLQYDVEEGWAAMAVRFRALCELMGWQARVVQRNCSGADGDFTEYLLQARGGMEGGL